MNKKDIKNFTFEELEKELKKFQVLSYRAVQIFQWIYKKGTQDFDSMSNIPGDLKGELEKNFFIGKIKLEKQLVSRDGTKKFLFKLLDGCFIESVLIPSPNRETLCLSMQVGCKFACAFCASGMKGFVRNLTPSEITGQVLFLKDRLNHCITNFVFMGMGEPMDNFDNLIKAIKIMTSKEGMYIGARRITVSTCGIIPGIEKFKDLKPAVNLSISLHASDDKLRDSLVPVNKMYPLKKLITACEVFARNTKAKITLEYVLIKDKNDSFKDAEGLARIAKRLRAKINLIPYSPVSGKDFEPPSREDIGEFKDWLVKQRVNVTVRESKGKDIHGACGQLSLISNPQLSLHYDNVKV